MLRLWLVVALLVASACANAGPVLDDIRCFGISRVHEVWALRCVAWLHGPGPQNGAKSIEVGVSQLAHSPLSEPYVRFSRIRLST